jgi:hypothetical protein
MVQRIIAITLMILGILTVTFFREYSGDLIPYPFLFWLVGFILIIGSIIFLRRTPSPKEMKELELLNQKIKDLKSNSEKFFVNFSECEIKVNSYVEEKELYEPTPNFTKLSIEGQIQALNALTDETRNTKRIQTHQSVIIYKPDPNNKNLRFVSRVFPYERVELQLKFGNRKGTNIYVDRKDKTNYYFDFEFLDEHTEN